MMSLPFLHVGSFIVHGNMLMSFAMWRQNSESLKKIIVTWAEVYEQRVPIVKCAITYQEQNWESSVILHREDSPDDKNLRSRFMNWHYTCGMKHTVVPRKKLCSSYPLFDHDRPEQPFNFYMNNHHEFCVCPIYSKYIWVRQIFLMFVLSGKCV